MIKNLVASVAGLTLYSSLALAGPLPTYNLVLSNGGDAKATYVGFSAADTDTVELSMSGTPFFINKTTPMGTVHDLGTFSKGVEIPFELTNLNTHMNYFTGPGSRNPDGLVHAFVGNDPTQIYGFDTLPLSTRDFAISMEAPDVIFVGFEDLPGNISDFDYNDLVFAVTTFPGSVMEPSTFALLLVAIFVLPFFVCSIFA